MLLEVSVAVQQKSSANRDTSPTLCESGIFSSLWQSQSPLQMEVSSGCEAMTKIDACQAHESSNDQSTLPISGG